MIKEIGTFIAARAGFAVGTTMQIGHRTPTSPDRCGVALESAGGGLHFDLPDRVDKMIQVISRAETYQDARDDAWAIYKALFPDLTDEGLPLGSIKILAIAPATQDYEIMTIEPLADPQWIGQDDKDRYEFSVNYLFRIQNA